MQWTLHDLALDSAPSIAHAWSTIADRDYTLLIPASTPQEVQEGSHARTNLRHGVRVVSDWILTTRDFRCRTPKDTPGRPSVNVDPPPPRCHPSVFLSLSTKLLS